MATTSDHRPRARIGQTLRSVASSRAARRLALGLLVALVLFNLLGFFGVPLLVRYVAGHQLSAALSRPVSVGSVSFNPNTLKLEVEQLHVGEREGTASFVDLGRLMVNVSWASLFRLTPIAEEVLLDAPQVQIVRLDPQHFNFSDLTETSAQPEPEPEKSPPRFQVSNITITGATIAYTDRANAKEVALRLAPLQLTALDLSGDFGKPWKIAASGSLNEKGTFNLDGTVTLKPLHVAMQLASRDLDVATVEPYFAAQLNASIASARLSADGSLSLTDEGGALKATYTGDAALGNVKLLDKTTNDLLAGWNALKVSQIKATYQPGGTDVRIGAIALSEFYARVILDARGQLNLSHVVRPEGARDRSLTRVEERADAPAAETQPPETPTAPATPLNLQFGQIALDRGHVTYTDNYVKPNFTADLTEMAGKVGAFGTQATEPAQVELQAKLNETAPVTIRGSVDPLAQPPFLDLSANARDVLLTKVTPYSTKYLGYPIVKGSLTVDLHYLLDKNKLTAENHVVIDQLTFGDHVPGPTATNLPVRLAISLLKNARGQIDVSVPVSGSLDDPQFSVGRLIWSAFANLIQKAVTSPFTLLARAFGGSEDLSYIEFAPGSAALTEASQKKLDTLTKALSDKPEVKLELTGRADPALDNPALREAYVERQVKRQKLKAGNGKDAGTNVDGVTVAPDEYEKYLKRAYKDADFKKERNAIGLIESQPVDEMKRLLAANAPAAESDIRLLAQHRAEAAQRWFSGKIAAGRIHVAAPKLDASGIADKGQTTRVTFELK
jgi:hypothetical protein